MCWTLQKQMKLGVVAMGSKTDLRLTHVSV
jgi:hypothetical protein